MISIDKALLRQLLLIERPWEVREYRLDVRRRRCDVWIAQEPERGWFGRAKAAPAGETESARVCEVPRHACVGCATAAPVPPHGGLRPWVRSR